MNFKSKYSKYKLKYLKLKYQNGGVNDNEEQKDITDIINIPANINNIPTTVTKSILQRYLDPVSLAALKQTNKKAILYTDFIPYIVAISDPNPMQIKKIRISNIQELDDSIQRFINLKSIRFRNGITNLDLGNNFNQPLERGMFPDSLISLTFGNDFNQPIASGNLPPWLRSLTFGNSFTYPIVLGVLPPWLRSLTFGNNFNQPIAQHVIPESVSSLTFGISFNHSINADVLPYSLVSLTLHNSYNRNLLYDGIYNKRNLTIRYVG